MHGYDVHGVLCLNFKIHDPSGLGRGFRQQGVTKGKYTEQIQKYFLLYYRIFGRLSHAFLCS